MSVQQLLKSQEHLSHLQEIIRHDVNLVNLENYDVIIGVDEVGRGPLAGPVTCSAYGFSKKSLYKFSDLISSLEIIDGQINFNHNKDYSYIYNDYETQIKNNALQFDSVLAALNINKICTQTLQNLIYLDDSKRIKADHRPLLIQSLNNLHHDFESFSCISSSSCQDIDNNGIAKCIYESMANSVIKTYKLLSRYFKVDGQIKCLVLVDGKVKIKNFDNLLLQQNLNPDNFKQLTITKGDTKSLCIAAGSNLAKYDRDNYMHDLARQTKYKEYGFNTNVGYGTAKHRLAISQFGLSDIHRKTFCSNLTSVVIHKEESQQLKMNEMSIS